jgi:transposase InsO family protein
MRRAADFNTVGRVAFAPRVCPSRSGPGWAFLRRADVTEGPEHGEVIGDLEHPAYGCNRIEALLMLEGRRVSAITIQKLLNERDLGTRGQRWLALERQNAEATIEFSPEQAAFLEKQNPCFRERHVESSAPGELLCADTFFVGHLKGVGKVYLHAVVDTHGSCAFGFLHVSKQPEAAVAVAVLHNDVLPFYRELDLPVRALGSGPIDLFAAARRGVILSGSEVSDVRPVPAVAYSDAPD